LALRRGGAVRGSTVACGGRAVGKCGIRELRCPCRGVAPGGNSSRYDAGIAAVQNYREVES
jgi:hypothetical protein